MFLSMGPICLSPFLSDLSLTFSLFFCSSNSLYIFSIYYIMFSWSIVLFFSICVCWLCSSIYIPYLCVFLLHVRLRITYNISLKIACIAPCNQDKDVAFLEVAHGVFILQPLCSCFCVVVFVSQLESTTFVRFPFLYSQFFLDLICKHVSVCLYVTDFFLQIQCQL